MVIRDMLLYKDISRQCSMKYLEVLCKNLLVFQDIEKDCNIKIIIQFKARKCA